MRELDMIAREISGTLQRDFERLLLGTMTNTAQQDPRRSASDALFDMQRLLDNLPKPGPIYITVDDDIVYKTRPTSEPFSKAEAFTTRQVPPGIYCRDQAAMKRFMDHAHAKGMRWQPSLREGALYELLDGATISVATEIRWLDLLAEMEKADG